VGAKLLYPAHMLGILAGKVQHAGVARNDEGVPYHPFLGWDADVPDVNTEREVNAVTGACYLVRRKVWDELGGWDPIFERGVYEDVDFCWQSRKHGYLVQYRPQACLYHYSSASEGVDGKHLLYDKRNENLARLMSKWQPLKSDEILFYGKKTMDTWQQANIEIDRAAKMIKAGNQAAAGKALEKAVKLAPNVPASRIAYAQWLAAGGKHAQAAEQIAQALRAAPAMWDMRLLLMDEWMAAGKLQNAKEELENLKLAFAEQPVVKEREAKLLSLLNRPTSVTPLSDADRAAQTFEKLLNAEDINEALKQNHERLDTALLSLVRRNAESAQADGNMELVEGLDALVEYIQANQSQTAKPKEKSSKRHKN